MAPMSPLTSITRACSHAVPVIFVATCAVTAAMQEPPLQVRKSIEPRTGAVRLQTNVPGVESYAQLDSVVASRLARDRALHGAVAGPLRERLDRLAIGERVAVRVWLTQPRIEYLNRFTHTHEQLREQSVRLREANSTALSSSFVRTNRLTGARALCGGLVELSADRALLQRLAHDPAVATIEHAGERHPTGKLVPLNTLASAALNPSAHPLDRAGAGVRAATVEKDDITQYRLCRAGFGSASLSYVHAELTFSCLMNAAPMATLDYCYGRSFDLPAVVDWVVDSGVETVSMSLVGDDSYRENSAEALIMDDFVYRWPSPLYCTGAGNNGWQTETIWQSYSAISSGSVKHWQEQDYIFDSFSQTRNPDPVYGPCLGGGATPCAGDRELPEVLTPGSHPYRPADTSDYTFVWSDPCKRGYFWGDGTSYSAPTLNGVAARVISSAPAAMLRHRPDATKMTLLLTARNVDAGEWDVGVDGRDGAGAVSAYGAVEYVNRCTDLSAQATPAPAVHGFYSGSGDSSMSERMFSVAVPDTIAPASHLRVALVWTSNPDLNARVNALSDLDIGAFTSDRGTYGSYSLDASVEIFDVPGAELTPGATYTFRVFPRAIRVPTGARTRFFYYTLGWTWVPDHASVVAVADRPSTSTARGRAIDIRVRLVGNRDVRVQWSPPAGANDATVSISDLRGAQLASVTLPAARARSGHAHLLLDHPLAPGVYVVKLRAGDRQATIRVNAGMARGNGNWPTQGS